MSSADSSAFSRPLAWFVRQGLHRPWTVVAVAAFIGALGIVGIAFLKVDPDLKALLPPGAESVVRLDALQDRIGTQSDLIVSVESPDRDANLAFARQVAERLAELDSLRYVAFERDFEVFREHALLYVPIHDLLELRSRVIERIRDETEADLIEDVAGDRSARGGEDAEPDEWLDRDPDDLIADYLGGGEVPGEFMEADEGRIVVVKARPIDLTTNYDFTRKLVRDTTAILDELGPSRQHPELRAYVRGEYMERMGESKSVGPDVWVSALFAVAALMSLIALYFRRWRAIPLVVLPIVLSTVATLGLGSAIYGTFNIVSTFIFAILLGLGIDFGIHAVSRYRHEREAGVDHARALRYAIESTGAALLYGGLTTAAVFFLLRLSRFQGFAQFGVLAGIGVLLGLLATFLVVPAMITLLERWRPWRRASKSAAPHEPTDDEARYAPVRGRAARYVAWGIVALSCVSGVWPLLHARDIAFEYDFRQLGPKDKANPESDPDRLDYRDAVGRTTTYAPAVALCDGPEDCEQVTRLLQYIDRIDDVEWELLWGRREPAAAPSARAAPEEDPLAEDDPFGDPAAAAAELDDDPLADADPFGDPSVRGAVGETDADRQADALARRLQAELGGGTLLNAERGRVRALGEARASEMRHYLRGFMGLYTFVPDLQAERLELIADIKRRIDRKRAALKDDTKERVDAWYRYLEVTSPVGPEDLPGWVVEQLREVDGRVGAYTIVYNGGSKADYGDAKRLSDSFFTLPAGEGREVAVAANYFVLVQVIDILEADGPVVIGAALLAVLLSLLALFRSVRSAALIAVPLVLSLGWLAGYYLLTGTKLNMFSVVAFPLVVGMGIDDGIHIYHRWRETPRLRAVFFEVGGAVFMTTLTTCIGFAGLLFANHQGIQSLGVTGALGMVFAMIASVVSLPALLYALRVGVNDPR